MMPIANGLRFDSSFIDQHDRYVVFYRVHPVALRALQAFWLLAVFERLLTGRTHQNFEEIFSNHA